VAIRNESGKWKWAIITAVYTILIAWVAAFITFRLASLLM
jgi:ferrous iron transport protein B